MGGFVGGAPEDEIATRIVVEASATRSASPGERRQGRARQRGEAIAATESGQGGLDGGRKGARVEIHPFSGLLEATSRGTIHVVASLT